jgi:hypothetical protein
MLRTRLNAHSSSTDYSVANARTDKMRSAQRRLEAWVGKLLLRIEKLEEKTVVPSPQLKPREDKLEKSIGSS